MHELLITVSSIQIRHCDAQRFYSKLPYSVVDECLLKFGQSCQSANGGQLRSSAGEKMKSGSNSVSWVKRVHAGDF